MPGPFPGMDPWLEDPAYWKGFHDKLIVKSIEALQPSLNRAGYFIDTGERVWIVDDERGIWPDQVILHQPESPRKTHGAALDQVDEPVLLARPEEEIREIFAEIYREEDRQLVTVIEIVSPANKLNRQGRALYQLKQEELRESGVHLVEIDLLRTGPHVLAISDALLERIGPWDYLVNLDRRGVRQHEIYPISLRQRLPRIRIPLKAGDEDAALDLQSVVDAVYDISAYARRLDYGIAPIPPLNPEHVQWADELLTSAGLRS